MSSSKCPQLSRCVCFFDITPCPGFPEVCLLLLRFSHGEVVYVSELREFVECDLSNLEEGSSCLVRHEDSIWYPARVQGTPFTQQ